MGWFTRFNPLAAKLAHEKGYAKKAWEYTKEYARRTDEARAALRLADECKTQAREERDDALASLDAALTERDELQELLSRREIADDRLRSALRGMLRDVDHQNTPLNRAVFTEMAAWGSDHCGEQSTMESGE